MSTSKIDSSSPSMVKGATLLIILQLLSRILTFVANQLLLRYLTAHLLGISTQLEVYYLSVLFFARESLRVAIQRQGNGKDGKDHGQVVVNLGYLSIALGLVVAPALGWIYLVSLDSSLLDSTPYLVNSLRLYGIAALVELLSEPCFVLMQSRLDFSARAASESIATFLRCGIVFGTVVWAAQPRQQGLDLGVLPFALGQLAYGVSLLICYLLAGVRASSSPSSGFSLLPKSVVNNAAQANNSKARKYDARFLAGYFYIPTISLAGSMMMQSVVKHILTQGDVLLISRLATPAVQGSYALANNYGGLLARLLFQPIEESSRSYFSRLLSSSAPPTSPSAITTASAEPSESKHDPGKDLNGDEKGKVTEKAASSKPLQQIGEAKQSLALLLRLYILLSVVVVTIGPLAAPSLLSLVAGRQWTLSGAGTVLAAYCLYIPFLALNGITESFVASVATESEVHVQSIWMAGFSVAFAAAAVLFMSVYPLGAMGLVLANMVNMLCRITWSVAFIRSYFQKRGVTFELGVLIPKELLAASAVTLAAVYNTQIINEKDDPLMILVKVAGLAIPLLMFISYLERDMLLSAVQSLRSRRKRT